MEYFKFCRMYAQLRYSGRMDSWAESGPSPSLKSSPLSTAPSVQQREHLFDNYRSPEPSLTSFAFSFPPPSPDLSQIGKHFEICFKMTKPNNFYLNSSRSSPFCPSFSQLSSAASIPRTRASKPNKGAQEEMAHSGQPHRCPSPTVACRPSLCCDCPFVALCRQKVLI